ncbi:MAG TPA: serine hydrolase domain-containing protein [Symbiobacteriaceae bacterium]|nr:serine hydrolase domain-containing protein [Symbiobacteriaceae bacterium]
MATQDPVLLERAFAVVAQGVRREAYAGAVAAVGDSNGIWEMRAFGMAAVEPDQVPMGTDTIFDLASLTKVVATTPAILRLLEEGAFVLETPVTHILPDFKDARVTMRHLLTHTSGLPAWRALYLDCQGWEEYMAAICAMPLVRDPGTQVEYSDLGFILLGGIIQRVTGQPLPEYCRRTVFEPLGMKCTWLPTVPNAAMAATERGNQVEYGMCKERAEAFPRWRREVIWGEVNDGNAHYGLQGVSSHAGLFGTADDLARYARAWLRKGEGMLGRYTVALATRSHTTGLPGENRGLGWQKPPTALFPNGRFNGGDMLSPAAFGHTGFTGTSVWIDPEKDLFAILLTNRLHPVATDGLFAVRPAFHNAVIATLQ